MQTHRWCVTGRVRDRVHYPAVFLALLLKVKAQIYKSKQRKLQEDDTD